MPALLGSVPISFIHYYPPIPFLPFRMGKFTLGLYVGGIFLILQAFTVKSLCRVSEQSVPKNTIGTVQTWETLRDGLNEFIMH